MPVHCLRHKRILARCELDLCGLGNGSRTLVGVGKPNERSVGRKMEDAFRDVDHVYRCVFFMDLFQSTIFRASNAGDQRDCNVSISTRISSLGICPAERSGHNRKDLDVGCVCAYRQKGYRDCIGNTRNEFQSESVVIRCIVGGFGVVWTMGKS